jgi:hypothetical protein
MKLFIMQLSPIILSTMFSTTFSLSSALMVRDNDSHLFGELYLIGEFVQSFLKSKSKSHYDRQLVGQPVLVSGAHLGPATNFSISLRFS